MYLDLTYNNLHEVQNVLDGDNLDLLAQLTLISYIHILIFNLLLGAYPTNQQEDLYYPQGSDIYHDTNSERILNELRLVRQEFQELRRDHERLHRYSHGKYRSQAGIH